MSSLYPTTKSGKVQIGGMWFCPDDASHFDHCAGRAALIAAGFSDGQAKTLFEPDCFGGFGFQNFKLSNNGANIRRMKKRLESISRNQATPATEMQGEIARVEDCPADNRVRLFFPGKPSQEVRSRLKSSGFRWSPTIGAWQAYRNSRSMETAKREAGISEPQQEAA